MSRSNKENDAWWRFNGNPQRKSRLWHQQAEKMNPEQVKQGLHCMMLINCGSTTFYFFSCSLMLLQCCTCDHRLHRNNASQRDRAFARLSIVCACVCVSRSMWVAASVHCICVYLHLCTQPTVHLECLVRSPSLAGKQMEETRAPCNGEIWCNRGIRSLQILAQTANTEQPLSANTKPDGWMLAILKKKKKTPKTKSVH